MENRIVNRQKVALCVIATGKYGRFVRQLWNSAQTYLLLEQQVDLFLFGDRKPEFSCEYFTTQHRPWPGPTLYRYHTMLSAQNQFAVTTSSSTVTWTCGSWTSWEKRCWVT